MPSARASSGDWLVKRPDAFTQRQTMAIGTAGYTAMLAVLALEAHEVTPDKGPVLVTGAAGRCRQRRHRAAGQARLPGHRRDGAAARGELPQSARRRARSSIAAELSGPARPLAKERWAGAIDVAGSHTLANVLSMTQYGGAVAAAGLAQGMDLPGSVAPFILRGVTLAGIDSVMAPKPKRIVAWQRLARDLDHSKLAALTVDAPARGCRGARAGDPCGKDTRPRGAGGCLEPLAHENFRAPLAHEVVELCNARKAVALVEADARRR